PDAPAAGEENEQDLQQDNGQYDTGEQGRPGYKQLPCNEDQRQEDQGEYIPAAEAVNAHTANILHFRRLPGELPRKTDVNVSFLHLYREGDDRFHVVVQAFPGLQGKRLFMIRTGYFRLVVHRT